ncbi:MGMT family protein [Candidatus Stoquefichus massiliensis]|uniref:MGMT family protein n=1 Tax=Candidatus Stoquefichus massiliensis TaxID=1470350 RepID=UPI0004B5F768|nr:MGMT family protein [Candidatus Stoquefichus massiliensis]
MLSQISYGEVITYGKIAREVADLYHKLRMSAQAIYEAVGHNLISIIIAYHRVVGSHRNLTGCARGIDKKFNDSKEKALISRNVRF